MQIGGMISAERNSVIRVRPWLPGFDPTAAAAPLRSAVAPRAAGRLAALFPMPSQRAQLHTPHTLHSAPPVASLPPAAAGAQHQRRLCRLPALVGGAGRGAPAERAALRSRPAGGRGALGRRGGGSLGQWYSSLRWPMVAAGPPVTQTTLHLHKLCHRCCRRCRSTPTRGLQSQHSLNLDYDALVQPWRCEQTLTGERYTNRERGGGASAGGCMQHPIVPRAGWASCPLCALPCKC